jgi:hypothetical protein
VLAARTAEYQAQLGGFSRTPAGLASMVEAPAPVVLSSEAAPTVVVLAPAGSPESAPAVATPTSVGGATGLKALELRSGLEGGAANGALSLSRLRTSSSGAGYYTYASPPPEGEQVILPPPPLVYVREVVTTVTTTYPAGAGRAQGCCAKPTIGACRTGTGMGADAPFCVCMCALLRAGVPVPSALPMPTPVPSKGRADEFQI